VELDAGQRGNLRVHIAGDREVDQQHWPRHPVAVRDRLRADPASRGDRGLEQAAQLRAGGAAPKRVFERGSHLTHDLCLTKRE